MRTMRRISIALLLLVFAASVSFGLTASDNHDITITISEVTLMALSSAATITLTIDNTGLSAGVTPLGDSDNSKSLEYTTINTGALERVVEAQLSVAAPSGTTLSLEASDPGDSGGEGVSPGSVTLSDLSAGSILTNIGSSATAGGGPTLTYTLAISDATALDTADSGDITVTLTLTEDA